MASGRSGRRQSVYKIFGATSSSPVLLQVQKWSSRGTKTQFIAFAPQVNPGPAGVSESHQGLAKETTAHDGRRGERSCVMFMENFKQCRDCDVIAMGFIDGSEVDICRRAIRLENPQTTIVPVQLD
ncbi:predicted protein [Uncinocarpus reesii 1704]|uniref:Uncharacterized protein n=1 Tax=Uncinocarpus reesii (strain UAMH 1704) TaxID=336963 RepID=C4JXA1_UNCRE|nr:uncharacterized protein UREG_06274 [Uncinocarpus reesii 1704]EEP81409.1 predicted protein [Uncinocarpus reesii 1704]